MRIVAGYDESELAEVVLKAAIKEAKTYNATLNIVHSFIERTDIDHVVLTNVKENLEKARIEAVEQGVKCDIHLLQNDLSPGEDIVEFAKNNEADLIVIGIKKRSRLEKMVFDSTARYVILKSVCPVLSVK